MNDEKALTAAKNYAAALQNLKGLETYEREMSDRWKAADKGVAMARTYLKQVTQELQEALLDD